MNTIERVLKSELDRANQQVQSLSDEIARLRAALEEITQRAARGLPVMDIARRALEEI